MHIDFFNSFNVYGPKAPSQRISIEHMDQLTSDQYGSAIL